MCDRNAKYEYILIRLCALVFEYICERTTKFHGKILFDSGVINLEHHGVPEYYHRKDLDILHKKSCILVHICMLLVVIAILMHRNTVQLRKMAKCWGETFALLSRPFGGRHSPAPGFGVYAHSLTRGWINQ